MSKDIAVVGCGYWGRNLVRNFATLSSLRTICDTTPDVLKLLTAIYPDIYTESEFRQVLANPEEGSGYHYAVSNALPYDQGALAEFLG